jgi:hypothetical protein
MYIHTTNQRTVKMATKNPTDKATTKKPAAKKPTTKKTGVKALTTATRVAPPAPKPLPEKVQKAVDAAAATAATPSAQPQAPVAKAVKGPSRIELDTMRHLERFAKSCEAHEKIINNLYDEGLEDKVQKVYKCETHRLFFPNDPKVEDTLDALTLLNVEDKTAEVPFWYTWSTWANKFKASVGGVAQKAVMCYDCKCEIDRQCEAQMRREVAYFLRGQNQALRGRKLEEATTSYMRENRVYATTFLATAILNFELSMRTTVVVDRAAAQTKLFQHAQRQKGRAA